MGYRSEIKFVFAFMDMSQRNEFVVRSKLSANPVIAGIAAKLECHAAHPIARYAESQAQWHDAEEKAFSSLIEEVVDNYEGSYAFIRLGEDLEDIHWIDGGFTNDDTHATDFMYVKREIVWKE